MADKKYILDAQTAAKKLQRIAYEILEDNMDEKKNCAGGHS
jgi:hypothetical protein